MENSVNKIIKTSVPEEDYKLKWIVENVSKLPAGIDINCTDFSPNSNGDIFYFCFRKYESSLDLILTRRPSYRTLQIVCEIKILDCDGKVYYETTERSFSSGTRETITITAVNINSTVLNELKQAPNDTWQFIFNIKSYQIIGKSLSETPSQTMREETRKNSFCSNFWKMFENKIGTDVTLQVQEDKIEAHKFVLSAQSPVLAKMFEVPMSESEKNTIVIEDIGLTAMTTLVKFLYSKVEIGSSLETTMELYYAADKYDVYELRELCGKILLSLLTGNNAGMLLEMADKHKDVSLKNDVLRYIDTNLRYCVKENWWNELTSKKTELVNELMNNI